MALNAEMQKDLVKFCFLVRVCVCVRFCITYCGLYGKSDIQNSIVVYDSKEYYESLDEKKF